MNAIAEAWTFAAAKMGTEVIPGLLDSIRKAPIALIDGKELINLMLEYEVGVHRKEVPLFEVQENLFDDVDDAR